MLGIPKNISKWQFTKDLYQEITDDNISNGGAALAYYFFFSIFPAMIFILSVLPFLPIKNLHETIMDFISQILPGDAAQLFEGAIAEVTLNKHFKLLSFGALLTIWAASSGINAIMQELNVTYDVQETRPFWKARGLSILLTLAFSVLSTIGFGLIVFGGSFQTWLESSYILSPTLIFLFLALKWLIVAVMLLTGLALLYYLGPDVKQEFKFISPGSVLGVFILALTTVGFRVYVANFGNYAATYGSIGAVIVLMLWLYVVGVVILLGSEINALLEHYSAEGKLKGEHVQGELNRPENSKPDSRDLVRAPLPPSVHPPAPVIQ